MYSISNQPRINAYNGHTSISTVKKISVAAYKHRQRSNCAELSLCHYYVLVFSFIVPQHLVKQNEVFSHLC